MDNSASLFPVTLRAFSWPRVGVYLIMGVTILPPSRIGAQLPLSLSLSLCSYTYMKTTGARGHLWRCYRDFSITSHLGCLCSSAAATVKSVPPPGEEAPGVSSVWGGIAPLSPMSRCSWSSAGFPGIPRMMTPRV